MYLGIFFFFFVFGSVLIKSCKKARWKLLKNNVFSLILFFGMQFMENLCLESLESAITLLSTGTCYTATFSFAIC